MAFYAPNRTYIIQLRRTIHVPITRVYKAWEDDEDRSLWFSPHSSLELVTGGKFVSDIGANGQFTEVIPMERWRMNWENPNHKPGSTVVIEFMKNGRWETVVHIRHWKIKARKDYDEIYRGWLWVLDSLESYLEKGEPIAYHLWLEQNMNKS